MNEFRFHLIGNYKDFTLYTTPAIRQIFDLKQIHLRQADLVLAPDT